jgi:hypothetical protein
LKNDETFLTDIKNFVLYKNDKLRETNEEEALKETTYSAFLNKVVPKTRVLFNLMKKNINGKLSLKEVVETLEPFLIYNSDLTYMQYKEINSFIFQKISEYNKKFIERSKVFSNIKRTGSNISNAPSFESLEILLNDSENKKQIIDDYHDSNVEVKITDSEFFTKIILRDFGNIFNYGVSLQNSFLMIPQSIHQIIEDRENKIDNKIKTVKEEDKCQTIIIAKHYNILKDLEDDNDKTIYFDNKYDSTNYSIIDDYLNQQSNMPPEEFIEFLAKKIQEKILNALKYLSSFDLWQISTFKNQNFNFFSLNYTNFIRLFFSLNIKNMFQEIYYLAKEGLAPEYVLNISPVERRLHLNIIEEANRKDNNETAYDFNKINKNSSKELEDLALEFGDTL